jgi:signal transduction histidine kinase
MESTHRRVLRLPALAGDTLLTLLAAVYASLHLYVTQGHGPGGGQGSGSWGIVLAVLCASGLLLRSRWPLATLLGVGGFGALYLVAAVDDLFPILPAVLIALYSAVAYSHRPRWTVWSVAVGVSALLSVIRAWHDFQIPRSLTGLLLDSGWMLIALLLGEALRSRHALAHEAELRAAQAERTQQEEAQRHVVEERLRIARELHDILAHTVALINVQAGVAAHVLDQQPEQARQALVNIKEASRATLQELRTLVGVLREGDAPAPLAPAPGLDALDALVGTVRDAGIAIAVQDTRTNGTLPATVDVAAYRILQESLTNAMKHAGRVSVQVTIQRSAAGLELDVTNTSGTATGGHGGHGHGILGMRERAAALGGSLEAGPTPDGGFRVHAQLPIPGGGT